MKLTKAHLFVVLLLALVFCSFFGGACGGSTLEGLNMPSDSTPYSGTGQYSDKYHNYGKMYRANDKFSKQQDKAYDRKDKAAAPDHNQDYTPSNTGSKSYKDDDIYNGSYAPYRKGHNHRSQGIPASQIPDGQEDLYMLKSEIVPPVCPACPAIKCGGSNGGGCGEKPPPPCPPCDRCPEPAFDCKKVPNYNSSNDNVLPRPVLNSFSQFGM